MAAISLSSLFVVVHPHLKRYSYDTAMPDEVFLTREEAQALADECNKSNINSLAKKYYVQSLDDRLQVIKDESSAEGMRLERTGNY